MLHLDPYSTIKQFPQFILWKLTSDGRKVPCAPNGIPGDAHDTSNHMTYAFAEERSKFYGAGYGVGFVLTPNDPFFCLDIDKCLQPDGTWSTLSLELLDMLPGALVEVSQSGTGLHVIGRGIMPDHARKNVPLHIELYSQMRFIALGNMATARGNSGEDMSLYLPDIVDKYFPPRATAEEGAEWTTEPVAAWNGYADDEELVRKLLDAKPSAAAVFGNAITNRQLWEADADALSRAFPPTGAGQWDGSSADASLAQKLAFYTGKNCERMERLMRRSALVRDKWNNRPDYLTRTILRACELQVEVFRFPIIDTKLIEDLGAVSLHGQSEAQIAFAEMVRAEKLALLPADSEEVKKLAQIEDSQFWLNTRSMTPTEIATAVTPSSSSLLMRGEAPRVIEGTQHITYPEQADLFAGFVYMRDQHCIFTPQYGMLKPEAFNAQFGGRTWDYQIGGKPTRKAFDAFINSEYIAWPSAGGTCFRPDLPYAQVVDDCVNVFKPANVRRVVGGDASPFLVHLSKLLPDPTDQVILLSYMAAIVQYQGTKFKWAPIIQGTEGNGKTLLSYCVQEAVGREYSHQPKASDIDNKFNGWMPNKVFYYVEDIFVSDHRNEVIEALKPMITNEFQEVQFKGRDQRTVPICGNFMFNSNHKNAVRITDDSRRFAMFYCAQQSKDDIVAQGMGGDYFPDLYNWLKGKGKYAQFGDNYGFGIVTDLLYTYPIHPDYNPAENCQRAPITSSTHEALKASLGAVEQEIMEAVEEHRRGFIGGWISSYWLDKLLEKQRVSKAIPHNKRRELLRSLGYSPHPGLRDGRSNNPVACDDGKKPRLYVVDGHPTVGLGSAAEIVAQYEVTQGLLLS